MVEEVRLKIVEVNRPEMAEVADRYSIEIELGIARDYCAEAAKLRMENRRDALVIDALVMAAVVRYIRCFHHTGKRISLGEADVSGLSDSHREWHDYFKAIRDKHVAHSVNVYEQPYVSAYVTYLDGVMQPFTTLYPGNERVVFNVGNAVALRELIDAVLVIARENRYHAEKEALTFLNSLPEKEIASFTAREPMDVSPKDVLKERRNGRVSRRKAASEGDRAS